MSAVTSEQPHFDVRCYGPAGVELADRVWPCYDEVFGDFPDALKWLRILIIIASGLYIIWRERRFASKPVSDTSEATRAP